jgi:uncharacterized small protein (DUF1192 family)
MMWATWLWRYAPHAILAAGLGLLCIYAVHTLREQGRAELRPQIERLEAALAAERADRARAERASDSYQLEIERLRERAARTAANRTPVRLCVTPAPQGGATPEGTNDPASSSRSNDGSAGSNPQAGPDIGADLYALAAACDAENAKLRALQGWILDGG